MLHAPRLATLSLYYSLQRKQNGAEKAGTPPLIAQVNLLNLTGYTVYNVATRKSGRVDGHVKRELLLRNTRGTADGLKLCFDYSCLPSERGGKQPQVGGIVWLSRLRTSHPPPLLHVIRAASPPPFSAFSFFARLSRTFGHVLILWSLRSSARVTGAAPRRVFGRKINARRDKQTHSSTPLYY